MIISFIDEEGNNFVIPTVRIEIFRPTLLQTETEGGIEKQYTIMSDVVVFSDNGSHMITLPASGGHAMRIGQ